MTPRDRLIKIAYENPGLRWVLLPIILKTGGEGQFQQILQKMLERGEVQPPVNHTPGRLPPSPFKDVVHDLAAERDVAPEAAEYLAGKALAAYGRGLVTR